MKRIDPKAIARLKKHDEVAPRSDLNGTFHRLLDIINHYHGATTSITISFAEDEHVDPDDLIPELIFRLRPPTTSE